MVLQQDPRSFEYECCKKLEMEDVYDADDQKQWKNLLKSDRSTDKIPELPFKPKAIVPLRHYCDALRIILIRELKRNIGFGPPKKVIASQ